MGDKLFELRRRTFDTPQFRGIEFIEVEAKSILNKVPGNRMPFNWTINPYRGCSHACVYCVGPDTMILMGDGRTRPISELAAGDEIYGTRRVGNYRRYVKTTVEAHWRTVKPAFKVVLEDDTEIIASGDHRFLTNRGWKHVSGAGGALQRPYLTTNNKLIGLGAFAHSRKRSLEGLALKSDAELRVVEIEDMGIDIPMYDITTGTGDFIADGVVSHNCFARSTHTFLDMNAGKDFESKIVVKVNAPELLRKELRAKRWKGEKIAMGTATDPYQRAEGRYKIMPRIIQTLTEYRNPFSILTKGTLILRDLEMLADAARVMDVTAAFSIATLDEEVWRKSEPGTPHPRKRVEAVEKLNAAGIPTGVLIAPILPGISDKKEQIEEVVDACIDAGATHIYPILLHLRPKVREVYMEWLSDAYPGLVSLHEGMYGRGAYASKEDQAALSSKVQEVIKANPNGGRPNKGPAWRKKRAPETIAASNEQLSLL